MRYINPRFTYFQASSHPITLCRTILAANGPN